MLTAIIWTVSDLRRSLLAQNRLIQDTARKSGAFPEVLGLLLWDSSAFVGSRTILFIQGWVSFAILSSRELWLPICVLIALALE